MKKLCLVLFITLTLNAENFSNSIGMMFTTIPSGSFMMGSADALPQHKKDVSSFSLQTTEVTQTQWKKVMGSNPSRFKGRNKPVDQVNYLDALEFIKKLNKKEGTNAYRLPTEVEWEYAARAGSNTTYVCGDKKGCVRSYAWYDRNSGNRTHDVSQKSPNQWQLFDISGNVWEWTSSCDKNENGECQENYKILRGGGYYEDANDIHLGNRWVTSPDGRDDNVGFRVVKTLK